MGGMRTSWRDLSEMVIDPKLLPVRRLKLPQQEYAEDSGVFLLHYAELFARNPFMDMRVTDHGNWFDKKDITKKRDRIRSVIYRHSPLK
eukprot:CAMPEP_0167755512 /NCGR_PEP_ID=MMETSP0110_2-20121227/8869_1 /TAXON_ID=629695 /ORGANISM="Gymnochlora sp., Strain CCMP2014" /LENGTH=88 /DNA_ID=CAMNT_0007641515 /DNA_START=1901 /DNA_END=2167 /DNA_ORIENTATION=-